MGGDERKRMRSALLHPVFLLATALGIGNQIIESFGFHIPVVHAYMDDMCIIPITLTLGLASYRIIDEKYRLTQWHIWSVVAAFAIYFELYLPSTSPAYTADILDVLMYSLGGAIFSRTVNRTGTSRELNLAN